MADAPIVHYVIPDVQAKPGTDFTFLRYIGEDIVKRRPDVIICLGDWWDMPSLSSYDAGTAMGEGRRLREDIEAGIDAMQMLLLPLHELQRQQRSHKVKQYKPRMVFTLGNHEQRLARHINEHPELIGFVSYETLGLQGFGWEVYDFLQPVDIDGISYVHYLANAMTGKPYGGRAMNQLASAGKSFVVGHKQVLDIAIRPILDGSMQLGIIAGACYEHNEEYKGHQGNAHWRGLVVIHDVKNGFGEPMPLSLNYFKRTYGAAEQ